MVNFKYNENYSYNNSKIIFTYKIPNDFRKNLFNASFLVNMKSYYLFYFNLNSLLDIEEIKKFESFFIRGKLSKSKMTLFQSVPIRFSNLEVLNCSVLLYLFRSCKFIRLLVGNENNYEDLIKNCSSLFYSMTSMNIYHKQYIY